ncbi:alpha/beta-hydrolase [Roridomyces roridus]|uniref:Alpha/beta-hydrolase n=1 Tax=Roridomyces roridus TaxID=1738132 RepID=A0AAD7BHI0_9AGAR|nr:alpha/beta-hydrolase [Roridomyces roridus]
MTTFTKQLLQIPSVDKDVLLEAWVFEPLGTGPFPLVVAGHGMTVIKDAGLHAFGERWATEGNYASIIFDYRYFGGSGGTPRNLVSLPKQREDYEAVLRWARLQPERFMNTRIVLMGSALSGLTVSQLAQDDPGLAGVMAHSPMLDGYGTAMSLGFNPRLIFWGCVDRLRGLLGLEPLFIKAIGHPSEFAFLNTPSSYPGFVAMFSQGDTPFSSAPNLINAGVLFEIMNARPGRKLSDARCPVLVVATKDDDIIPAAIAAQIAKSAPEKVTLVEVSGGHFDIMEGGQSFSANIKAQLDFLQRVR